MDKHEDNNHGIKPGAPVPGHSLDGKPATPSDAAPNGQAGHDAVEPEPAFLSSAWWAKNGSLIFIVAAGCFLCFYILEWSFWGVVKAAVGLSFVVFIHELGHFLVAKWCDVNVTTFSIGFGPSVPGCSFQWGETNYRLGLIPLGGYVQMVGQVDGDEGADGSEEDPRSFRNKSVGQRMAIISAGVVMNVILAMVIFVVVFRGPGKDRKFGGVGSVDPGTPAFTHGLRSGMVILKIGDIENPTFEQLMVLVMGARRDEEIYFEAQRPGDSTVLKTTIVPRNIRALGDKKNMIGLTPPFKAELAPENQRYYDQPAFPESAAAQADPPFEFGDRIVGTTDPDNPAQVKPLPPDPRFPQQRDYFELSRRFQRLAGREIVLRVERGEEEKDIRTVDIKVPPTFYQTLGARMKMGHITGVRNNSPAQHGDVRKTRKNGEGKVLKGDIIQKVIVAEADGSTKRFEEDDNLDPERLPHQLREWAQRMEKAGVKGPWKVKLAVKRYNDFGQGPQHSEIKELELEWDNDWRYDQMFLGLTSPLAIPEAGLAYQIKTTVAGVDTTLVNNSKLQRGDALKEIRIHYKGPKTREGKITFKDEDLEQWAFVAQGLQNPLIEKVTLKVSRGGATEEIEIVPVIDKSYPLPDTGLTFAADVRRQWAESTPEAITMGFKDTWDNMTQVFQNLRGMITGTISTDNLGGPVTIARVAYFFANMDFWEFVFFLGLISVNLAVINFLPIPVLDGGHMVFLIYEKLRGKPASEGVRVGATYAGLALILCLMVFVLYLDISRLF